MVDAYKDRLATAMKLAGKGPHALAEALGVSYTAVKSALKGGKSGDRALTAANNSVAAKSCAVDPDWLATGEGSAYSVRVWPFVTVPPQVWNSIDISVRVAAEKMLLASVKSPEVGEAGTSQPAKHNLRLAGGVEDAGHVAGGKHDATRQVRDSRTTTPAGKKKDDPK